MTSRDIAWLAGLLEGEGCFSCHRQSTHHGRYFYDRVTIQLGMTDRDIVVRAAKLLTVRCRGPYRRNRPNHKPMWNCYAIGKLAAGWMMTLYPFMGERRRSKIRECLQVWVAQQIRSINRKASCHPDREHYAHNLCSPCYQVEWKQCAS